MFGWKEWELINRKEFSITGSWMSYSAPWPGKEWQMSIEYMGSGELKYDDRLLDKVITLENTKDMFKSYSKKKTNGRIMISI